MTDPSDSFKRIAEKDWLGKAGLDSKKTGVSTSFVWLSLAAELNKRALALESPDAWTNAVLTND